jgi:leucyl aminopeptidase
VHVEATTDSPLASGADTIVVGVCEGEGIAHDLPDGALGALLESGEARRAPKAVTVTHAEGRRWIVVGLGDRSALDGEVARVAAALAHARARELGTRVLCWEVPHHVGDDVAAGLVEGTLLHAYSFDRYKRRQPVEHPTVQQLILSAHHDISTPVRDAAVIAAAQNRARDLGNTPPNDLTPAALAEYAQAIAGVDVTVLDGDQIRASGMGAFAAVAQGSAQDPRLIRIEYHGGADESAPLLGLVGKAVTFDAGGLTVKPPASIYEMKFDMCGGAAVIEAIAALAELEAPGRVLGVIGATENVIGAEAMRPGDIVRALDGTTIEINNPDAEGRMVLADCITYALREGCDRIVDVATLTGGIVNALGAVFAGLFSNDERLATDVHASAARSGDGLWRMPLHPGYEEMIKGRYAELTNRSWRRDAFPCTAAEFLHHFAGDTPWAHLDIAGTAYDAPRDYLLGKGATGFGVRLLVELARGATP